jgi:hypothetical protein
MAEGEANKEIKDGILLTLVILCFAPPAIFIYYFIYGAYNVLSFPPEWVPSLFWVSFITVPIGISIIAILWESLLITPVRTEKLQTEKEVFNSSQPDKEVPQTDKWYMVPPSNSHSERNNPNPTPASQMKGSIYVVDGEIEALYKKWREEDLKRIKQEKDAD